MDFSHNIASRKQALQKLLDNVILHETDIIKALQKDFRKPEFETIATETAYVISELRKTITKIESWAKPKRVGASLVNFPSKDYIYTEPYGKVLIISPWNYPFQLAFCPLIAAIAAGNSVVLKPSELTPETSSVISMIIRNTFDVKHAVAVLGDASVAQSLLEKRWDYIFFTGSVATGKIVARAAALNLTPVTLELGGKNPCIVDETANLERAAKRIVWGKFINAGQTCIAPDYILVKSHLRPLLLNALRKEIIQSYGEDPKASPDFARIVNADHFKRLEALIDPAKVSYGGVTDKDTKYISPTLITEDDIEATIMKDEIFGPLLPVLSYSSEAYIQKIIGRFEKPLALYVFSENKAFAEKMITRFSFGGGTVNDTVVHFSNENLPFGGVGFSGMGAYHGKRSFDTFSHHKGITKRATWMDISLRYPPYGKKLKFLKKVLNWIS